MKLLIHTCCADCALKLVESAVRELGIKEEDITLFYFNPNIHPRSEFLARKDAVQKAFVSRKVQIKIGNWQPSEYFAELKNCNADFDVLNNINRCPKCWELRMRKSFEYAKKNNFEMVTSTLFSSKYQSLNILKSIIKKLSDEFELKCFIPKNIDREKKTKGFYKQNYCGCVYSLKERMEEKWLS